MGSKTVYQFYILALFRTFGQLLKKQPHHFEVPVTHIYQQNHTTAKMENHMDTVNRECIEIQKDIKRLGMEKDGHFCVEFGTLFDDDKVQQYYEALVGTLKAAKKRGIISFQSPMLLKGKFTSFLQIEMNLNFLKC